MSGRAHLVDVVLRVRYLVLLAWAVPWLASRWFVRRGRGDWLYLQLGARTLVHHDVTASFGQPLHLYAINFEVQMGPPALLLGAPFQWLPEHLDDFLGGALLVLLLFPSLWLLERAVSNGRPSRETQRRLLLAGLVIVPCWSYEAQYWGHIDDVVALVAMSAACFLISRGRHDVLAGVILGTGVAAKPWAVILLPLLFAYPRVVRPRAVLAFVVAALAWWLPFVIADPATIHALGALRLRMINEPTWRLVGFGTGRAPGWIRPLQLLGGLGVSTVVVRRRGWQAVPLVALAWRVTTDPYDWPYYAMGPLLGAVLWDLHRRSGRQLSGLPWATLSTFVAELFVERELHLAAPAVRLAWFLGLTVCVFAIGNRGKRAEQPSRLPTQRSPQLVGDAAVAGVD